MAAILLRKILTQNSKLIKGYHLLALILMKNQEWNKARRILRKAAKIDKTNTTTLRFLREVDEQTGVTTRLEKQRKGLWGTGGGQKDVRDPETEVIVRTPAYKERSRVPLFVVLMTGVAAGAAAFWFLAVPAIRQGIYRQANQQIVEYSESLASQGAQLSKVQGQAQKSGDTAEAALKQIEEEQKKSTSYQALFEAYAAMQQDDLDSAALKVQQVYASVLPTSMKAVYNTICSRTGVSGIEEDADSDSGTDDDGYGDSSYDDYDYDDYAYEDDDSYYDDYDESDYDYNDYDYNDDYDYDDYDYGDGEEY
jgi:hypothetical protein